MPEDLVPPHPPLSPELQRVVADLLDDLFVDLVVDDAVAEVRAEVPVFAAVDEATMRDDVAGALALASDAIRSGVDRGGLESDTLRSIGALRAEQGVDVDALLAGFRVVARVSVDTVIDRARRRGVDSHSTLELTRAIWVHCDDAAAALAAGHRAYLDDPDRHRGLPEELVLRRLVRGDLRPEAVAAAGAELGLAPGERFRVVLAGEPGRSPEALRDERRDRLPATYVDRASGRLVALVPALPLEPWGVPVGYGDLAPLHELRHSFDGAAQAWELAVAFGIERPQHADDVQLLRPVVEMPELGDRFVERCFGHLEAGRRDAAVDTLRAWFEARGSVDVAAEALFVHRNTMRYRLRTFGDATGLHLDRPEDAFTVWWALRRLDLLRR